MSRRPGSRPPGLRHRGRRRSPRQRRAREPALAGELVPLPAGNLAARPGAGPAPGAGRAAPSRYAGAMLAHAYYDRIGAEVVLAAALPPGLARPRYDDLALLAATSLAFALGVSSAEGTKHLIPDQAGILAGIGRLPGPAHAAAPAGRDRRPMRPARAAAPARRGDAGRRRPGPARVLRR